MDCFKSKNIKEQELIDTCQLAFTDCYYERNSSSGTNRWNNGNGWQNECLPKIDHYGGMKGVGVLRKMFGLIILVSSIAYSLSAHLHIKEQIDFIVIGEWEFACNFPQLSWQKILILLRKLWFAA